MKKIWIIISVSLILLSALLFTIFLFSIKFNFRNLSNTTYHEHVVEEEISAIEIHSATADINVISSNVEKVKVGFSDSERKPFSYDVVDGVLKISYQDNAKWYQIFNWGEKYVNVYLPEKTYEYLTVDNSTGDVTVNGFVANGDITINASTADIRIINSACANAKLDVSTGNIEINNLTALEGVNIDTTTGDVDIDNSTANDVKINGSSSSIEINGLIVNNTIDLNTTTGSKSLENVKATNAKIQANTGDVELENFILSGELFINTTKGEVEFSNTDCASAKISTTTGDVIGSFLTDKIYYANTNSGKIRVPHSTSGGVCEISTSTGDVFIGYGEIDD